MKSNFLSKFIFTSCVRYYDRASYWVCVLVKGIGRLLPLDLQCSLYQVRQGDVSQCAETKKPVVNGDQIRQLLKEMHQIIKCIL